VDSRSQQFSTHKFPDVFPENVRPTPHKNEEEREAIVGVGKENVREWGDYQSHIYPELFLIA
jgi:hypothetical protein